MVRTSSVRSFLPAVVLVLPFLLWLLRYWSLDIWPDELWSLREFVLVDVETTLKRYPAPNNHVLFNLLQNLSLSAIGVRDLDALLRAPWLARLVSFACTLGTLVYVLRLGGVLLGRRGASLALIILTTTVPFYNFALQARGYALGTALFSCGLFHLWRFEDKGGFGHAAGAATSLALCIWAIPANFYFVAALGLWGLVAAPRGGRAAVVAAALLGAFLLYLPILPRMLELMRSHGLFRGLRTLSSTAPLVYYFLASGRWLLVESLLVALVWCARCRRAALLRLAAERPRLGERLGALAAVATLPFLFSWVRGDYAPMRIFVLLAPVTALLAAAGVEAVVRSVAALDRRPGAVLALTFACCQATFAWSVHRMESYGLRAIDEGIHVKLFFYNYHQVRYQPGRIMRLAAAARRPSDGPVILFFHDGGTIFEMARLHRVPAELASDLDPVLKRYGRALVVTKFPNRFVAEVRGRHPGAAVQRLNAEVSYFNLFEVRARSLGR